MDLKRYFLEVIKGERRSPEAFLLRGILWVCSLAYMAVLACLYLLYRMRILPSYRVSPKVISVGNITLGGTGKTPFTIKLA